MPVGRGARRGSRSEQIRAGAEEGETPYGSNGGDSRGNKLEQIRRGGGGSMW